VIRVLADGTYLSVVMDSTIRGPRRDKILAAARAGHDLGAHPDAAGKQGLPVARLADRISARISVLQSGRIHIYLLYSFVTLLVLLIFVR